MHSCLFICWMGPVCRGQHNFWVVFCKNAYTYTPKWYAFRAILLGMYHNFEACSGLGLGHTNMSNNVHVQRLPAVLLTVHSVAVSSKTIENVLRRSG